MYHMASVPGYPEQVHFSLKAITNIFAMKTVRLHYRITYDCDKALYTVHREPSYSDIHFEMTEEGLHVFVPEQNVGMAFVNTVSENKERFSKRQLKGAQLAKELYAKLVYPSLKDFKWAITSNQIKDCPVTVNDIDVATEVWGKDISALKGKTTRRKPVPVQGNIMKVPKDFMRLHQDVFLTLDIFFVTAQNPFLLTLSRKIDFTSATHLANRKLETIYAAFKEVYQFYRHRGFRIETVHCDGEFQPLGKLIESLPKEPRVNLTSANEHVPEIERRIRVVKERARAVRHALPFTKMPNIMTIHMVLGVVRLLTFFASKAGVSQNLSPRMLMLGETLDYKRHLSLQFGEYCQVHEEDTPRNSQSPRTKAAICMGPSGNKQGGFKFMSLHSGKKVTRQSWDRLPMPDTVIARVNLLGKGQPEQLTFLDRKGHPIGDVELTGVGDDNGVEPQIDAIDYGEDESTVVSYDLDPPGDQVDDLLDDESVTDQEDTEEPPLLKHTVEAPRHESTAEPAVSPAKIEPAAKQTVAASTPTETPGVIPGVRRSTRTRVQAKAPYEPSFTGKKYDVVMTLLHGEGLLHPDTHMLFNQVMSETEPDAVAAIMTQLSLKAGLKQWKGKAHDAAYAEMKQLHMRDTFRPRNWKDLTLAERKAVLESHLFLNQKRDGNIKGRTVAGGNKQRDFISKEDASSPTVSTEAVLLTCVIDAEEERDVSVIDIPNAFIQTRVQDPKDMVIIRVRGVLVDMLVEIDPKLYGPYVTTDKKGVKQLLLLCLNAIYGTMVASLLYYNKFCKSLLRHGFELNPYDPCVANRIVNGKQQTVCFHVDDCKISHADAKVNDKFIQELRDEYETIFEDGTGEMKVSRGKVHKYLGMVLDYTVKGQCKISMFDYIKEIIQVFEEFDPNQGGTKPSAAPKNLFVADKDCKKLHTAKAEKFHSLVAKVLFATKRARPDTGTAVSYLTTRVREPDEQDWDKLVYLIKYLRDTVELPLILSADGSGVLKWHVDGSYTVHPDMRGHTGGGLTMGRGYPISASTKQKLNTRSSTECELVGVDDLMPSILWTRNFLEAQGYGVRENIVFQDNRSAILLEKNGKASSSKRTKHINIRYFFVTDMIKKKRLSVEWKPTEDMVGDFWTKPNQGSLFLKHRNLIMGVEPPSSKKCGARASDVTAKKA